MRHTYQAARETGFYRERIVREPVYAYVTSYKQRAGWQRCKPLATVSEQQRDKYLDGHLKRWAAGGHEGLLESEREERQHPALSQLEAAV